MRNINLITIFSILSLVASCSTHTSAFTNEGEIKADIILKTTKSWDGKKIEFPDGESQVTILKILIPKGTKVKKHCHPVPSFGYMVKGELEVEITGTSKKNHIQTGDAIPEVTNTWHSGFAIEDTEIIVFYTGNTELPLTIKPESKSDLALMCK